MYRNWQSQQPMLEKYRAGYEVNQLEEDFASSLFLTLSNARGSDQYLGPWQATLARTLSLCRMSEQLWAFLNSREASGHIAVIQFMDDG